MRDNTLAQITTEIRLPTDNQTPADHLRELALSLAGGHLVADDDIDPLLHDLSRQLASGLEAMMLEGDLDGLWALVMGLAEAQVAGSRP